MIDSGYLSTLNVAIADEALYSLGQSLPTLTVSKDNVGLYP